MTRYVLIFLSMLPGPLSPLIDLVAYFGLLPIALYYVKCDRCGRDGIVRGFENDTWADADRERNRRIRGVPKGFTLLDPGKNFGEQTILRCDCGALLTVD
ncbi:MAG: hypothetical protein OXC95_02440 [Dehalococcoidia bacterium]|nr:hypothetical protein [Dehalococcoidia bacterium]